MSGSCSSCCLRELNLAQQSLRGVKNPSDCHPSGVTAGLVAGRCLAPAVPSTLQHPPRRSTLQESFVAPPEFLNLLFLLLTIKAACCSTWAAKRSIGVGRVCLCSVLHSEINGLEFLPLWLPERHQPREGSMVSSPFNHLAFPIFHLVSHSQC